MIKKPILTALTILVATLSVPQALRSQSSWTAPTMDQLVCTNTLAHDNVWNKLSQFGMVRDYHQWALDLGYSNTTDYRCAFDPAGNKLKWTPSYDGVRNYNFADYYSAIGGRGVPALMNIAPEMRGWINYPAGQVNLLEQKPFCGQGQNPNGNGSPCYFGGACQAPPFSYPNTANPTDFLEYSRWVSLFAYKFGSPINPSPTFAASFFDPYVTTGESYALGLLSHIEITNEPDKNWWGGAPQTYDEQDNQYQHNPWFYKPEQYAALLSAAYDGHASQNSPLLGIKNIAPKMRVVAGGLSDFRGLYYEKMFNWCVSNRANATKKLPFDVLNVHHYSTLGNQPLAAVYNNLFVVSDLLSNGDPNNGISPEHDALKGKIGSFISSVINNDPTSELENKDFWLSEFGYDTHDDAGNSFVDVPDLSIPSDPDCEDADRQKVQAQWLTRSFLEISAAKSSAETGEKGIDRAMQFTLSDDPTPGATEQFSHSGLLHAGLSPKRSWYYVMTLKNVLSGHRFKDEGIGVGIMGLPAGESANLYKYESSGNANEHIFVIWSPTALCKHFEVDLDFSSYLQSNSLSSATFVHIVDLDENGRWELVPSDKIVGKKILDVPVSETPLFIIVNKSLPDPVYNMEIKNLHTEPFCCNGVSLHWQVQPGTFHNSYKIYYARESELDAINGQTCGSAPNILPRYRFNLSSLHTAEEHHPGGQRYAVVTGLPDLPNGEKYIFFVIPERVVNGGYLLPSDLSLCMYQTPGAPGCMGNQPGCVLDVAAGAIGLPAGGCGQAPTNCPPTNILPAFSEQIPILLSADNVTNQCAQIAPSTVYDYCDFGWFCWIDDYNTIPPPTPASYNGVNQFTVNFQVPKDLDAIHIFHYSGTGDLVVEYQDVCCAFWQPLTIVSFREDFQTWYTLTKNLNKSLTKIRFKKMKNASGLNLSRIFFCGKDGPPCQVGDPDLNGPTGGDGYTRQPEPSDPGTPFTETADYYSVNLRWDAAKEFRNSATSAYASRYQLFYSSQKDVRENLVNPQKMEVSAEGQLPQVRYQLAGLAPATTYFGDLILDPYPYPCPLYPGLVAPPPIRFSFSTTSYLGENRSSAHDEKTDQASSAPSAILYPNPANQLIEVRVSSAGFDRYTVTGQDGKTLLNQSIGTSLTEFAFSTVNLPEGLLTLTLYGTNMPPLSRKVIVRH
ncbi:MAG: hypothetical protein H7246_01390 [Phycisphaerae bacterium]|nr:hypothetical protein [Saprospiraceae bacterium]